MADTLSMIRAVQLPPLQPLEISSPAVPSPVFTCVTVPLQTVAVSSSSTSSPITLHTLMPKQSELTVSTNNINNNNNNNSSRGSNNQNKSVKKYKHIEPATPEMMKCKRKISFQQPGLTSSGRSKAASVARRNERERNRVKQVNLGFERLRQHVPNGQRNKKMSKVETLRSALEYIHHLQELLGSDDPASSMGLTECQSPTDISEMSDAEYNNNNDSEHCNGQTDIVGDNLSPVGSVDGSVPSPSSSYHSNAVDDQAGSSGDLQSPLTPDDEDFLDFAASWLMQTQS